MLKVQFGLTQKCQKDRREQWGNGSVPDLSVLTGGRLMPAESGPVSDLPGGKSVLALVSVTLTSSGGRLVEMHPNPPGDLRGRRAE